MDTFFTYLKKTLVATMFTIFAFVAVYTPQDWNQVDYAHAGGGGLATEATQIGQALADKVFHAISIAKETITAIATNGLFLKDTVLDGVAWTIAKMMVQSMVQTLIEWINSGFEGSPAFVQNLKNFLRQEVDAAISEYIAELGAVGSFICEPWKINVQLEVQTTYYEQIREERPLRECDADQIINNLEGYTEGDFISGGWNDWFDITSAPALYTSLGAHTAADMGATIRMVNTRGEESAKLEWGDGFLSGEICEIVQGSEIGGEEECFITKPGKIIEEALSFNLDSGRQALITADEIDEIIAALLAQLANKAITGAAGLLGLTNQPGESYAERLGSAQPETDVTVNNIDSKVAESLAFENNYRDTIIEYRSDIMAKLDDPEISAKQQTNLDAALTDVNATLGVVSANIVSLNDLKSEDPAEAVALYNNLPLHDEFDMTDSISDWQEALY